MGWRWARLATLAGFAVLGAVAPAVARATAFTYTGTEQTWTVPAGVTQVDVAATGAPGGGTMGGEGAMVNAQVTVPAGVHTLYVEVGGPGVLGAASFNGGGPGLDSPIDPSYSSDGGGGASDVRSCSAAPDTSCATADDSLDSRLVVVAAGGGGEPSNGNAGGNAGADGSPSPGYWHEGGYAATQTGGGAQGGSPGCDLNIDHGVLGRGGAGSPGAIGGPDQQEPSGGGGGGGLYGGGGGMGVDEICSTTGGGGGGGSSFVAGNAGDPSFGLDSGRTPGVTIVAAGPSLDCTFTVNGRYRSSITIDATYLEHLGVPAGQSAQVLDNLAARALAIPADWNVQCLRQGTFGPPSGPSGGDPDPSGPTVSCQMNTTHPSADSLLIVNESRLQALGVSPSAWDTVLDHLRSVTAHAPSTWGVACTG